MNRTLSPFPRMCIERYRLSVTLRVIVLFLARKYQQTLDTSLETHPTVFPSTTTAAHDYAHFGSLLGDLHTVPVNSNYHTTSNPELHGLPAVLGVCNIVVIM